MAKAIFRPCAVLFLCLSIGSCHQQPLDKDLMDRLSVDQLNTWNKTLTDAMVKDIFSPPVASRIYVYSNIAAYEILAREDPQHRSLSEVIKHLGEIPEPDQEKPYYLPVSAIIAFSEVAQQLVYSYEMVIERREKYLSEMLDKGIPQKTLDNSVAYGKKVAAYILIWASEDGYKSRNNYSQIIKDLGPGTWKPTPPDFLEPIEPNWHRLRTFLLDSSSQFAPGAPTEFAISQESQFYQESYQVYKAVMNASEEQVEIAQFWDCNPNASHHMGHMMKFQQKISPGAHWILIASEATRKVNPELMERSKVFTYVSLVLADGFISCWNEKYKTVVIRPETYINKYIDQNWKPILQTPAFPEYTSGHSVVSAASATMLTRLLGENFAFTDSTEVEYGLPVRSFKSFSEAANEAAISRLYGGIHYMPAITNGVRQGKELGDFIADNLNIGKTNK